MEKLKLSFVADAVSGKLFNDNGETQIENVFTDSRVQVDNGLFVALKGDRFDGNDFCVELLETGKARCVICSRFIETEKPFILVDDTKKALGSLAKKYRELFDIKVVGLTGSVGKTTTKDMTSLVLSGKYKTVKTQGNHNNDIGLPLTIFDIDKTTQCAVIEMGMNHFGEISYLTKIAKPDVCVITKIGVSHIENLGSRENIMKAKLEILDGCEKSSPIILNGDDDLLKSYTDDTRDVLFFSVDNKKAFVTAKNIRSDVDGQSFDIVYDSKSYHTHLSVDGIHNVYDSLAAFAVGIVCGVQPQKCAEKMREYEPVGLRQKIEIVNGVTLIEDCYNASPDSVKANLRTLVNRQGNKKIAVLGDMLELGEKSDEFHEAIGDECALLGVDELYCYGEKSKLTFEKARKGGVQNAFWFDDKEKLSLALKEKISVGDVVLIKGSHSMKMEEIIDFLKRA